MGEGREEGRREEEDKGEGEKESACDSRDDTRA